MVETVVKVMLNSGLHARPASHFVKLANKFSSQISLVREGKTANAKSIIGIMSMAITKGSDITLRAEGEDAQQAIAELTEYLSREEE